MIATTIEQSKHLLELGVDPKTADMSWVLIYDENHMMSDYRLDLTPCKFNSATCHPAWSLSALLQIIKGEHENLNEFFDLRFLHSTFDGRGNHLIDVWCISFDGISFEMNVYGKNPIDAAVEMIEWLCKMGYMGKEGEK